MRVGHTGHTPCSTPVGGGHCLGEGRVGGTCEVQRCVGLGLAALHGLHDALDLLVVTREAGQLTPAHDLVRVARARHRGPEPHLAHSRHVGGFDRQPGPHLGPGGVARDHGEGLGPLGGAGVEQGRPGVWDPRVQFVID